MMKGNLMNEVELTKLLYNISSAYEHKIAELNSENKRLKHLLNDSVIYKIEMKIKSGLSFCVKHIIDVIKYVIIQAGLKENIKKSNLYKKYKNKGSF